MAAIDFPNAPVANQIFVAPNGVTYQWTGALWLPIGGTQALSVGDTPPPSPGANQLWWNSSSGQLYLWYNDGSSTQWVPAMPILPVGVPSPVTWRQLGRVVPIAGQLTVDFPNIPADINDLRVHFDVAPQVASNLQLRFSDATGLLTTSYYWGQTLAHHVSNGTASAVGSSQVGYTGGLVINYGTWPVAITPGWSIRGRASIYNIRDTNTRKGADWQASYFENSGTYYAFVSGGGWRDVLGAITGIQFSFGNGGMQARGAITLWGSP
jgi:hypothetical protein